MEAVENLHQRAFARAIFAEQRVNFARLDGQIHIVVREHARKALHDVSHRKGGQFHLLRKKDCTFGFRVKRRELQILRLRSG